MTWSAVLVTLEVGVFPADTTNHTARELRNPKARLHFVASTHTGSSDSCDHSLLVPLPIIVADGAGHVQVVL